MPSRGDYELSAWGGREASWRVINIFRGDNRHFGKLTYLENRFELCLFINLFIPFFKYLFHFICFFLLLSLSLLLLLLFKRLLNGRNILREENIVRKID